MFNVYIKLVSIIKMLIYFLHNISINFLAYSFKKNLLCFLLAVLIFSCVLQVSYWQFTSFKVAATEI